MVGNLMWDFVLTLFGLVLCAVLIIVGLSVVWFVSSLVWSMCIVFYRVAVPSARTPIASLSGSAKVNPNDFWDEPNMGTYVTMADGSVRID